MKIRKLGLPFNKVHEVRLLTMYLKGFAEGTQNERLYDAAEWLEKLQDHVCAGGCIGCTGGETCTLDHK